MDRLHAPDASSNKCAAFLHPYIEYHSFGKYIDLTELQESLIIRFDAWTSSKFPQWPTTVSESYVKHFINEKVGLNLCEKCHLFQAKHPRSWL